MRIASGRKQKAVEDILLLSAYCFLPTAYCFLQSAILRASFVKTRLAHHSCKACFKAHEINF